jgi:glucose-1-phosphate thymidylyltransferase
MNIIVPMAGMGKRMRPHTLTIPKPLIPIAGKPIVERLCEDLAEVCDEKIDEIGFVIGRFGEAVEKKLISIAEGLGAKGKIYYQDEALGTAHAILCAEPTLHGKTIVAFADTLFKANFQLDEEKDGILWVQKIEDQSQFGVVQLNSDGVIEDYVEKPETFISDLAMIGIYYFKDGDWLKKELQYLIDNKVIKSGEYQLPDALRNMTKQGANFYPGTVDEWLDCGNKNATVNTNQRVLEIKKFKESLVSSSLSLKNSQVIEPCYIGDGVELVNSVVGPHVSIGKGTKIENSRIENSVIQEGCIIKNQNLSNTMLGNAVQLYAEPVSLSLSDYSTQGI